MPAFAYAQGAASGMFGVKEIVIQYAHFADPKTAGSCGLTREDIADTLKKALQDDNVPAISAVEAKPPMAGVARIDIVPEVSSLYTEGLDCTSWVSLTAKSQSNVVIPPVNTLRSVKIVYWDQGLLIASEQTVHGKTVADALQKMAHDFARQYHSDQPPEIK